MCNFGFSEIQKVRRFLRFSILHNNSSVFRLIWLRFTYIIDLSNELIRFFFHTSLKLQSLFLSSVWPLVKGQKGRKGLPNTSIPSFSPTMLSLPPRAVEGEPGITDFGIRKRGIQESVITESGKTKMSKVV